MKTFISFDTNINETINSITNVILTFYVDLITTESDEWVFAGIYFNSNLYDGFWNETYADNGNDDTCFLENRFWNESSFW